MKKLIATCLAAGLIGSIFVLPADAKKKRKPVATTLYLEGASTLGEEDQTANGTYLKLQADPGAGEKSMGLFNLVASPNTQCAGNSLMPVFVGTMAGKVTGDMTISFEASATAAMKAEVRVWPDVAGQACNETYIEPAASTVVDLPAGRGAVEAKLEGLNFTAQGVMMIQVTPVLGAPPGYARVWYGTDAAKVEFLCTPNSGTSCI